MSAAENLTIATEHPQSIPLPALVESILYAAAEPATISSLAAALDASVQDIETALADLAGQYTGRGVRLQRLGNQVQLVTAPEAAERVQKFLGLESLNRLSSAAIETLAIIAYRQPITRPQIEMIRGVNCDGVMKTLEQHNLIQELGRAETVGRPMRYGVSFEFLQYFGLTGAHELPPLENLDVLPAGAEQDEFDTSRPDEEALQPTDPHPDPAPAVVVESADSA